MAWPDAACLRRLAGATESIAPQNLFLWNPHWQCFAAWRHRRLESQGLEAEVWDQNNCSEHVEEALNTLLGGWEH